MQGFWIVPKAEVGGLRPFWFLVKSRMNVGTKIDNLPSTINHQPSTYSQELKEIEYL